MHDLIGGETQAADIAIGQLRRARCKAFWPMEDRSTRRSMTSSQRHGRTLRLHRETLRQLTGASLARVAGGSQFVVGGAVEVLAEERRPKDGFSEIQPKSTGFTGDEGLPGPTAPTC